MVIPSGIYALCEEKLRNRHGLVLSARERLEEARAAAYAVHAAPTDGNGGGHGSQDGSDLERKALRIHEAEEELRQALAWDDVARRLYRALPITTQAGQVANYLYERGMAQETICGALGIKRATFRQYRDKIIVNCALFAVQAGLIDMEGTE